MIESTWLGGEGLWSDTSKWQPAVVPRNSRLTEFNVLIDSGRVTLNTNATVNEFEFGGRVFEVDSRLFVDHYTSRGYYTEIRGGVVVEGDFDLISGTIGSGGGSSEGIQVGGDVIKSGYQAARFVLYPSSEAYQFRIRQGSLGLSDINSDDNTGSIVVENNEFADLSIQGVVGDDVHLNNGHGFAKQGALVGDSSTGISLSSDIHLGDQGATISGRSTFGILGSIHGGRLDIFEGTIDIRTSGHTYSGATVLTGLKEGTRLRLSDQGSLHSTSRIELHDDDWLQFINGSDSIVADRLGDDIPIVSYGGVVELFGPGSFEERVGSLQLEQGYSQVIAFDSFNARLRFESLQRMGFSTLAFRNRPGNPMSIGFAEAPALENSIIGPWAITTSGSTDLATYDPVDGVVGLGNRIVRPAVIEGAAATDHVWFTSAAPLSADHTVASLVTKGGGTIDLGGHALRLGQGALVFADNSSLLNGSLTAGAGSESAMIYAYGHGGKSTIAANIADNVDGGSVGIVVNGSIALTGANSYTGPTVSQATLAIESEQALPVGTELIVEGGIVRFDYTATRPALVSRVVVNEGRLYSPKSNISGAPSKVLLDADEFELTNGRIEISLTGDGSFRKTTEGIGYLEESAENFTGSIVVEEGALIASEESLGTQSSITVHSQAKLVGGWYYGVRGSGQMFETPSQVRIVGGDLGVSGAPILGAATQTELLFSGESRLLMFDYFGDTYNVSDESTVDPMMFDIGGTAYFENDSVLQVLGYSEVAFNAGIQMEESLSIELDDSTLIFAEITSTATDAHLSFDGKGQVLVPSQIQGTAAGQLVLEIGQKVELRTTSRSLLLSRQQELVLNGVSHESIALLEGTLSGVGSVEATVTNNSGLISPGESIGTLSIDRLNQLAGGTLLLEIQGGDNAEADLIRTDVATLRGDVVAELTAMASVRAGDTFDLVVGNSIDVAGARFFTQQFDGYFEVVTLAQGPDAGMQSLRLTVVAIPEPTSACLLLVLCLGLKAKSLRRIVDSVRR
ncbi:hypothetical protein [Aeoliella sp.]|uniref:hypothetical protein n=1 Tax=Aeoliella sp. TaxID=2795800 RepID=UPI003CCBF8A3